MAPTLERPCRAPFYPQKCAPLIKFIKDHLSVAEQTAHHAHPDEDGVALFRSICAECGKPCGLSDMTPCWSLASSTAPSFGRRSPNGSSMSWERLASSDPIRVWAPDFVAPLILVSCVGCAHLCQSKTSTTHLPIRPDLKISNREVFEKWISFNDFLALSPTGGIGFCHD